jgi:hypothetical protein
MKILSVEAELFHAVVRTDRQTDMTKLIVDFRNLANAPKIVDVGWICMAEDGSREWTVVHMVMNFRVSL